jgi:predicted tellurium resistance membrane protein TerC
MYVLITAVLLIVTSVSVLAHGITEDDTSWWQEMKEHHEAIHGEDFEGHHQAMHGDEWREHISECHPAKEYEDTHGEGDMGTHMSSMM